jgi:hypothetical protein
VALAFTAVQRRGQGRLRGRARLPRSSPSLARRPFAAARTCAVRRAGPLHHRLQRRGQGRLRGRGRVRCACHARGRGGRARQRGRGGRSRQRGRGAVGRLFPRRGRSGDRAQRSRSRGPSATSTPAQKARSPAWPQERPLRWPSFSLAPPARMEGFFVGWHGAEPCRQRLERRWRPLHGFMATFAAGACRHGRSRRERQVRRSLVRSSCAAPGRYVVFLTTLPAPALLTSPSAAATPPTPRSVDSEAKPLAPTPDAPPALAVHSAGEQKAAREAWRGRAEVENKADRRGAHTSQTLGECTEQLAGDPYCARPDGYVALGARNASLPQLIPLGSDELPSAPQGCAAPWRQRCTAGVAPR